MRTTYHAISGIVSPHDEELPDVIPKLGRAVFYWLARHMVKEARQEFRSAAVQGRRTGSKSAKQDATAWYLIMRIANEAGNTADPLALRMGRAIPPSLLRTFSVFASWYVREGDTKRVAGPVVPPKKKTTKKRGKSWPVCTRSKVVARLAAYRKARAIPNASPEANGKDPLAQLHQAVCNGIAKTALVKRSLPGLETRIDPKWPNVVAGLSNDTTDRVALAVGHLLVLRADRSVWTHDLDFKIEPLLREVLVEVTRRKVRALVGDPAENAQERARRLQSVGMAIADHVAFDLLLNLEIVSDAASIPSHDDAQTAAAKVLADQQAEIQAFVNAPDLASGIALGKALVTATAKDAIATLRRTGLWPGIPATFEGPPDIAWHSGELHGLYNSIVAALHAIHPFTLEEGLNENRPELPGILRERLESHFGNARTYTVAIPTTMRSGALLPIGEATSEGTVVSAWSVQGAPQQTASTRLVLVRDVRARDEDDALQVARIASDLETSVLWFALDRKGQVDITEEGYVRDAPAGTTHITASWRSILGPPRTLTAEDTSRIAKILTTLRTQTKSANPQRDIWRRLGAGFAFLKTSLGSQYLHERILYLWLALEAVFSNFEWETKHYEDASPIGTRVAYRCATTLQPKRSWPGLTYGHARWVVVSELLPLYRLRCATVHEGEDEPSVDDVTFRRWVSIAEQALTVVGEAALQGRARTVEEVVAFYETRFPVTAVV